VIATSRAFASGRALVSIALVLVLVPLAAFALVGWFSRYAADDYCTAAQVVNAGLVDAQSHLYVNWSGRFAATLLITTFETFGISALPILPALALVAWLASLTWTLCRLTSMPRLHAALLSAVLVYATLQVTADMPQDLYWQTGLITYLLPLILATLLVGRIARANSSPGSLAIATAIAFVAGGTNETFAAAQVTALVLGCAFAAIVRREKLPVLLAALIGGLAALAIIAVAPGNEVRQTTSARTPLGVALPQSLQFLRAWLRLTFARPHAIELALLIVVPALLAPFTPVPRPRLSTALFALASVVLVLLACMLPAFYALDSNPPGRAQLIPEVVILASVGLIAWYVGAASAPYLERREILGAGAAIALVLLVVGPLAQTRRTLATQLPDARAYAATWDTLDQQVRADRDRGVQSVTIKPLPPTGSVQNLDFVGPDRDDWFNQCVAGYYRVSSIAASPAG
jgi:hypothetical protein